MRASGDPLRPMYMKQDIFDGRADLADPTEDIDDVLSKFDAIN